jgi:hypothetical protein
MYYLKMATLVEICRKLFSISDTKNQIIVTGRLFQCTLFMHSFIYSFRSVSCYKSISSSKANSPQSAMYCSLFKFAAPFRFLKITQ